MYVKGRRRSYFQQGGEVEQEGFSFKNIAPYAAATVNDVSQLFGSRALKRHRGEKIGTAAGSVADTTLNAFGIPTFGLGRVAGQAIGGLFDDEPANKSFSPSGNTSGYYRQYGPGGHMSRYKRTYTGNGLPLPLDYKVSSDRFKMANGGFYGRPIVMPGKAQMGGTAPTVEIEGGEYVFQPRGIDDRNFKMLDNTGKSHASPYGFVAQGSKHGKGYEGGIKVAGGDAYIASAHLGVDGRRAGKGNPSVASLMIKNGGKVLAHGAKNKWDKFAANKWNPGVVKHHISLMEEIKSKAELGKIKQGLKKQLAEQVQYRKGGIVASSAKLKLVQAPNLAGPFANYRNSY